MTKAGNLSAISDTTVCIVYNRRDSRNIESDFTTFDDQFRSNL